MIFKSLLFVGILLFIGCERPDPENKPAHHASAPNALYGIYEYAYSSESKDQRQFSIDHKYTRWEYYHNNLFRFTTGTWEIDRDTIKVRQIVMMDYHHEYDTIFSGPEKDPLDIPLKQGWIENTDSLQMFRWADNNFPAEWEIWKKIF
jgi:hypothetical protein